jgi:anti-sigma factor RsiW
MTEHPSTESERLDEELVAYLDGELEGEAARRMEHRLASEETVRRRLQQLAQSWDLLDQLPRTTVDDNFTRSTVEIVALAAEEELGQKAATEPRRRWMRWLLTSVAAVGACWIGFFVVVHLRPDPNQELLRDLPVIENQEVLKEAGDIDFLRKLDKEGLFPEESGDAP